jgi:uracil-DNA glycosylase
MEVAIHPSWKTALREEFDQPYFASIVDKVKTAYRQSTCYPPGNEIFTAFNHCPFEKVKVVIIGQDPYHGPGQANGLCFSVKPGIPHPPSLINIFKEIETDLGFPYPNSGDLSPWAKQGVLLLNASLTVKAQEAGSHQFVGWEKFTDAVIRHVAEKERIVFMLWGGFAKKKIKYIPSDKHCILTSGHPSPLSANRGFWFGNRHFSMANKYLEAHEKTPVNWKIE